MITCQHATNLFDRYLDGELPASLQAELHAHQLSCVDCQMELAILEACGDVVALDRRGEPALSASFTDRVLLANRAQTIPKRRSWGRMFLVASAPLAAAASIALAVLLIPPTSPEVRRGVVAGDVDTVSPQVASLMGASPASVNALQATPSQMPASFVDRLLQPGVEQARNSVDGIRQGVERLESLLRLGLAGSKKALAAGRTPSAGAPALGSPSLTPGLPDLTDPSSLFQSPAPAQPSGRGVAEVPEAL